MRVKFIFYGLGFYNCLQANIKIYDSDKLIFTGITFNREIDVCLEKYKSYLLIGYYNGHTIKRVFYIDDKTNYFYFSFINSRIITFQLKDANYNNLPIEKGEIILWQR